MASRKTPSAASKPAKPATHQNPTPAKGKKGKNSVSKQDVFVQEYLVDLNGRQAAIRAGYSPDSARYTAVELLAKPEVQAKIQAAMEARAEKTGITAERVLEKIWAIATADASEVVEVQYACCRYCYGKNFGYQRTPRELREALFDQQELENEAAKNGAPPPRPLDDGGIGWDADRDPNPKCPECRGKGALRVVPKDTRDLSPTARLLYAGVKTTQNGMEVKTRDQDGMLANVARHLGMFKDKIEVTGKNGGPIAHQTLGNILDELGADGADTGPGASS